MDAAAELAQYLNQSGAKQETLRATKPTDTRLRAITKHAVPPHFRGTARMILTNLLVPQQARRARAFTDRDPLLLHLGSGGHRKDGWINIDLVGDPVELAWNLARPLPFADNSVDGAFHEHLLEHLPLEDGAQFMAECHRVLKPGAVLRVGVPDAGRLLDSYAADRAYLEALHPGRPTAMLGLQELFYWHRHCTMFDTETLGFVFRAAGFTGPDERPFGETKLPLTPDTDRRKAETLYVEAVK